MSGRQKFSIMLGLSIAILAASLDLLVVSTAMPKIISDLHGGQYYAWPLTIYSLTMAISIPLMGKLSDIYGFKQIYLLGIFVFFLGSLLSGVALNIGLLILGRAIQGAGGAVLSSNSLAAVGILFPPEKRTKYMGILGSMGIIASLLGPGFGGWLTQNYSWRWLFLMNLPIILLTFIIVIFTKIPFKKQGTQKNIDYIGASFLTLFAGSLTLFLTWGGNKYSWSNWHILVLIAFNLFSLAIFLLVEKKSKNPIIPLNYFKNHVFTISSLAMFIANGVMAGILVFLPLYLRSIKSFSSQRASLYLTPFMISMVIMMIVAGLIIEKTKKYKLVIILGNLISIIGIWPLTQIAPNSSTIMILSSITMVGIGMGLSVPVFTSIAQSDFSQEEVGTVTGAVQFFKTIGMTAIPTILMTVATNHIQNKLDTFNWPHLSSNLLSPLKHATYLLSAGFINKFLNKVPNEIKNILEPVSKHLNHFLSSGIDASFVASLILLVIMLLAILMIPTNVLQKKNS